MAIRRFFVAFSVNLLLIVSTCNFIGIALQPRLKIFQIYVEFDGFSCGLCLFHDLFILFFRHVFGEACVLPHGVRVTHKHQHSSISSLSPAM